MTSWYEPRRPAHLRPVAVLGNQPPPRGRPEPGAGRPPSVAARCEECRDCLPAGGAFELGPAPGERVYRCPSCKHANVFYSAEWLSVDQGGTP